MESHYFLKKKVGLVFLCRKSKVGGGGGEPGLEKMRVKTLRAPGYEFKKEKAALGRLEIIIILKSCFQFLQE